MIERNARVLHMKYIVRIHRSIKAQQAQTSSDFVRQLDPPSARAVE